MALTIIWGGVKLIRRLAARQREVVYKADLAPGEGIRIRNVQPGSVATAADDAGA